MLGSNRTYPVQPAQKFLCSDRVSTDKFVHRSLQLHSAVKS